MRRNYCWGIDLHQWVNAGLLQFQCFRPSLLGLESHLFFVQKFVGEFDPSVVVMDPISDFVRLGTAVDVAALDADTAVVFTVTRSLDGKSIVLHIGDSKKSEPITEITQQEKRIREAVEQGKADHKTEVLLKAEKKVRLVDLFRVATAASVEGVKLHVAVVEIDK